MTYAEEYALALEMTEHLGYATCEVCGSTHNVSAGVSAYAAEIYDAEVDRVLCDNCWQDDLLEI